jgi:hypothetical protein
MAEERKFDFPVCNIYYEELLSERVGIFGSCKNEKCLNPVGLHARAPIASPSLGIAI